ncbi:hypothetical protein VIA_000981 [Vibrio orientalis CIP 102891 = ATCC 33934]|uniref:Uncharacterized protein n=1 Tax=Vibrio orientalis CIP 102891 = ATCC 33934 TaxID=675816 RepID=A0ABP2H418_VIBOR|nr:hypothetical protein VIA_000981 [Vibrio orientalis CIP 102891 = ATCC 33934]
MINHLVNQLSFTKKSTIFNQKSSMIEQTPEYKRFCLVR